MPSAPIFTWIEKLSKWPPYSISVIHYPIRKIISSMAPMQKGKF
jgi:hypothetical protein